MSDRVLYLRLWADYGCPRINEAGHGPISLAARMADKLADGSKAEYYSESLLRRIENP
ncbi:hypothetical protein SAMN05444695_1268 [Rhodococcus triatomae]|uniref:Uncharacterized protein n=1 Tax=Rhodococcus triatomae TaxID=300028 RepID=A0A1G8SY05_9NOCA|nr:hypothetical protein SAMN05444695_1268 [Rhodococcus triatomae]